jgi:hypothetical protein
MTTAEKGAVAAPLSSEALAALQGETNAQAAGAMHDDFMAEFDEAPKAAPVTLAKLVELGQDLVDAEAGVAALEEALSDAKKRLHHLKTSVLPDAMAEAGLADFSLADGSTIAISDFVSGSLPKDPEKREKAIKWLEEHDGAALIKTDVSLAFGKSQHNQALDLVGRLREEGHEVTVESGVHASTLQSFAKDVLRNGGELDADVLGLFVGRAAKVKAPKAPKAKKAK